MGQGRFGPVFRADDPETHRSVVIRTFEQPLDSEQRALVVQALEWLCQTSLDHPGIARPITAGLHGAQPYVAHEYLSGTPLDEYVARYGPQPISEVTVRVTQLAAAIDYAAAVGVHHGTMGARDVIVDDDSTGVTGVGLVQAMAIAGVSVNGRSPYGSPARRAGEPPTQADDVYSLAAITYELLHGVSYRGTLDPLPLLAYDQVDVDNLREAFDAALAADPARRPASALAFAALLQGAAVPAMSAVWKEQTHDALDSFTIRELARPEPDDSPADDSPAWAIERTGELAIPSSKLDWINEPPPPADEPTPTVVRPSGPVFASIDPPPPRKRGKLALVAALAIGLGIGYAGGFLSGGSSDTVMTVPAPDTAPATVAGTPDPPRETNDRTSTEVAVAEPKGQAPAAAPPVSVPPEPPPDQPPPAATADRQSREPADRQTSERARRRGQTPSRPVAAIGDTPGAMQVLSRPPGADVFVDGKLLGKTPLVLPQVAAGEHVVTLDLMGYQRWVATVRVESGGSARVAASLEH